MSNFSYIISEDGKYILVDKPVGVTPFECVKAIKLEKYKSTKIGYAGRLDPMASGLVLLLVGDENKLKHKYENLSKQYVVEILLGVSTDSQDLLGIVQKSVSRKSFDKEKLDYALKSFVGMIEMEYPIYSSKRVFGKPLFYHAHSGNISKIAIPTKEICISGIKINFTSIVKVEDIFQKVERTIPNINGKFRQQEIMESWKSFNLKNKGKEFQIVNITVDSEAGAYMRWLAQKVGEKLQTPSLAYSILRTKIGEYKLSDIAQNPNS